MNVSERIELFKIAQDNVTDIEVIKNMDYIEIIQDYDVIRVKLDDVKNLVESLEKFDFGVIVDKTNDDTVDCFSNYLTVTQSNFREEYVNIADQESTVTIEKSFIQSLIGELRNQGIA